MGFKIEDDLNTERSRKAWLEWKRRTDPLHYLDPIKKEAALRRVDAEMMAEGWVIPNHYYGTINCNGVNARGDVCGVTTTSGLAWKIPGRVGDSPILGAGLYVDGEVGAAGSTGRGEANLYSLASFLIVEGMRRGLHPKDAGLEALKRIKANTVPRLLNKRGEPTFNINFYILNKKGDYAGVAMYSTEPNRARFAVCDEKGPRLESSEGLLQGNPSRLKRERSLLQRIGFRDRRGDRECHVVFGQRGADRPAFRQNAIHFRDRRGHAGLRVRIGGHRRLRRPHAAHHAVLRLGEPADRARVRPPRPPPPPPPPGRLAAASTSLTARSVPC